MYSQNNEESAILQHTPTVGRFLDVGAFHQTILSNTRALYERGWSGVLIEPSPVPMTTLLKEYGNDPRITLIQGAMAASSRWLTMHATNDCYTTSSADFARRVGPTGGYYGKFCLQPITWDSLIVEFGQFDFVSIDAEGESADLAIAMFAAGLKPRCVCVELDGRPDEVLTAGRKIGDYIEVLRTMENTVIALQ